MDRVMPFRAWRYQANTVGDLSRVIAPPYDVIGPELQAGLHARSPYNVARVDLGAQLPGDSDANNRYTRAAALLSEWKTSGAIVRDLHPGVTWVEEEFTGPDGRRRTRSGFLGLIELHDFSERVVFPHEFTLSGPKEDRFRLMRATEMSLSPVFLLYDLPGDAIAEVYRAATRDREPVVVTGEASGDIIRLWPTFDPHLIEDTLRELGGSTFVIADGHHRYETALRYRDSERDRDRGRSRADRSAYEYALAYFGNVADPGLAIFGTHRLVSGLSAATIAGLPGALGEYFRVEELTADPKAASAAMAAYLSAHQDRGRAFGLYAPQLGRAFGFWLSRPEALAAAIPDHSEAYRHLDVAILHALVIERVLAITPEDIAAERHIAFVKDWNAAVADLDAGRSQVGFFMNPTRLAQVREIAMGGERMPQKATFFYPKLPTGLVFHDLSDVL